MAQAGPTIVGVALTIRRGRTVVVDDAPLEISPGLTALVGPNGAGKTSLLRVLATVAAPAGGSLTIGGDDPRSPAGLRRARARLGYLPQAWDLPFGTRVIDALRHAAWLQRVRERDHAVERAIATFDLGGVRRTPLHRLSGGTHRRVAVAQALLHEPSIVLLDEPTAGLDHGQAERLWERLRHDADGRTVVVATHDLASASARADAALAVRDGRLRPLPADDLAALATAAT